MTWENLQKEIADRYCGTVMVLDDEIYERSAPGRKATLPYILSEDFSSVKRAFEQRGALCDLWHIEEQFGTPRNSKPVLRALHRCDTVIVDWYLGRGKDHSKDSTNALKVLRELQAQSGFRFAAIHSKEESATILNGLKAEFVGDLFDLGTELSPATEEEDVGGPILVEGQPGSIEQEKSLSTYRIGESLYVCILQKGSVSASAAELPDVFYNHLKRVFSDHLHWVGFEFAARTKELLPALLQSLPTGTDTAVVFQSLLQEHDELSDCLIECLTIELRALMRQTGIISANDETLISRMARGVVKNCSNIKMKFPKFTREMKSKWNESNFKDVKNACKENGIRAFTDAFFSRFPTRLKACDRGGLSAHKDELSEFISLALGFSGETSSLRDAHDRYASVREHLQSCKPTRLTPGVILRRSADKTDGDEWIVCISPECDCARGSRKQQYLFIGGISLTNSVPGRSGTMQSCLRDATGACHHVKWDSKRFQTNKWKPEVPIGYDFFVLMHSDFTNSLIHAVWGHETRVGVSTSDFLRKERES